MKPSKELYESLDIAFDFFNKHLFDGELPDVMFTVQRKKGVLGYFAPDRWGNQGGQECHEIAMNPSYVANSRLIEVMQTLVHEMTHCWQFCYGTPGRDYYHNKEWAMKMIKVGLMPSSTGEPGGDITGQNMGDYIIEGGLFLEVFKQLESQKQFQLAWVDRYALPRLYEPTIAPLEPDQNEDSGSRDAVNMVTVDPETDQRREQSIEPYMFSNDDRSFMNNFTETTFIEALPQRKTRNRYVCKCVNRVYGKPSLEITCKKCGHDFEWVEYENKKDP